MLARVGVGGGGLIANETIDSRLKANLRGLLRKLDIEKVYDHVNWNCVITVMDKMGFGSKWLGWIRWCISTVHFSVLVNDSPFGFFNSSRGLRQGDPLFPYLFILGMEILSCLISRAKEDSFIEGFWVKERNDAGVEVSHLFFADDTLIFCNASKENLEYLSWVFMWFEACSGLKINLEKSELIPIGEVQIWRSSLRS